jgi:hypothetical protein
MSNFLVSYNYHNMDIIHRPVFYLKHNVLETGFCLRLKVEPTELSQIDRASLYLRRQRPALLNPTE